MTTPDSRQSISQETGPAPASQAAPHSSQRLVAGIPLRTKLIIAFLAVALVPLALLSLLNDRTTRQALTDAANEKLKAAAEQTRDSIDSFIQTNLSTLQTEAQLPEMIDYLKLPSDQQRNSPQETQALGVLRTLSGKNQNISSYALLDSRGLDVLDTYAADTDLNKFTGDYFQKPLETHQPYASPLRFSATTGELALYFSAPVENAGEIIGVLAVRYKAEALQQLVTQKTDLVGKGSFAILLDEEDHIRLADGSQPQMAFKAVVPLAPDRLAALKADGRLPDLSSDELATNLPGFEQGLAQITDQQPYFAAELHSAGEGLKQSAVVKTISQRWLVVFAQPQEVFLAPVAEQTSTTVVVVLVIAIVVTAVAVSSAQLLTNPIFHLTTVARQVAAGNLAIRAHVQSRDETGVLASAFNRMTDQLQSMVGSLEQRIQARTKQLRASADVGRAATSILDTDQLLHELINLITDRFGFYYAAIFTLDPTGKYAVLREATGEVGHILKERGHKLETASQSMVGAAIASGRARIALDVGREAVRFANPLLPDTRSEIALPLLIENRILGVLDVQSTQAAAFDEASAEVLQSMADQIAIALNNAALHTESKFNIDALNNLLTLARDIAGSPTLQDLIRRAARTLESMLGSDDYYLALVNEQQTHLQFVMRRHPGQEIDEQVEVRPLGKRRTDYVVRTRQVLRITAADAAARMAELDIGTSASSRGAFLGIPIITRGQILGVIGLQDIKPEAAFTDYQEKLAIALADQLAVALENLRLTQKTQETLAELDMINRRLIGQAWDKYARASGQISHEWYEGQWNRLAKPASLLPPTNSQLTTIDQAADQTPAIPSTIKTLQIPIQIRGETIGEFTLQPAAGQREWVAEDIAFAQALVDQVGQMIENARLLEGTERLASRERTINEINSRVRQTVNMDVILKTAVNELGRSLQAARVFARINPPDQDKLAPADSEHENENR